MSAVLVVFDTQRAPGRLVGHEYGAFTKVTLDDGWFRTEARTVCGRLLAAVEWVDMDGPPYARTRVDFTAGTSWFREDTLLLVGRRCSRCPATPDA